MKTLFSSLSFLLVLSFGCGAQVIRTVPAFPTADDHVTLYFDAALGNGALQGIVPIFCHTGVITSNSPTPTSWQYVVGNWGTAQAATLMTYTGGTIYSFNFGGQTLRQFYNVPENEAIYSLAFVFRNTNGSVVGRAEDGSDMFYPLATGLFEARIFTPEQSSQVIPINTSLQLFAQSSALCTWNITVNGTISEASTTDSTLSYTFQTPNEGWYELIVTADNGTSQVSDTLEVLAVGDNALQDAPAGTHDGINYIDNSTVRLQLLAPQKEAVFVVGDFNNWQLDLNYKMKLTTDSLRYWLDIPNLTPGQEYGFHYHIFPDNLRLPDAYADKYLMRWDDDEIPATTYPGIRPFPVGLTSNEPVSTFQTAQAAYAWTDQDYVRPPQEKLVIYELLVRDFSNEGTFRFVQDSLDYLQRLGITAIEIMPFTEFPGNSSWGYNTAFYFAPDKAYGTKQALKDLINAAHERGIAVVMDVVFNHADTPNPFIKMYWQGNAPAANNPWFNRTAPHSLTWFYDWNHESIYTKQFVKRFMEYWTSEYHIDGWRWDFSQGMTQTNTLNSDPTAYDASRIAILSDYAQHIWSIDPAVYMILEHWTQNQEQKELADLGCMLWGGLFHDYQEGAMGYFSDFTSASYVNRQWQRPGLITYMESHDEERVMYKNLNFGNANLGTGYDITELDIALRRVELTACFHALIPGPKMLWQFGELGYDYSINYCTDGTIDPACRLSEKPVRWDYYNVPQRKRVYQLFSALHGLKRDYDLFTSPDFEMDVNDYFKIIRWHSDAREAVLVGNFFVAPRSDSPQFPHAGVWYEYFTGDSLIVPEGSFILTLREGEYRLYTDFRLQQPDIVANIAQLSAADTFNVWPVPASEALNFPALTAQSEVSVYNSMGQCVMRHTCARGMRSLAIDHLPEGMYVLRVENEYGVTEGKFVKAR